MAESQKESILRVSNETMSCLNEAIHELKGTEIKFSGGTNLAITSGQDVGNEGNGLYNYSILPPFPKIFNKTYLCQLLVTMHQQKLQDNITSNGSKNDVLKFLNEMPNDTSAFSNFTYMSQAFSSCYGDIHRKVKFITTDTMLSFFDFLHTYMETLILSNCTTTQDLEEVRSEVLDNASIFLDTLEENKTELPGSTPDTHGEQEG